MRLAVRRTVSVGGATAVAIGAALALAIPASAHTPTWNVGCQTTGSHHNKVETGKVLVSLQLSAYAGTGNTVEVTEDGVSTPLLAQKDFNQSFTWSTTVDGTDAAHKFTMTITAQDDPGGLKHGPGSPNGQWDGAFTLSSDVCKAPSGGTPTPPPPTQPPTQPPSHSVSPSPTPAVVPQVASTTTTTAAPVGAATLPNTGVNVALPLGIAGALVVVGGGILAFLRFGARRKRTSN